ncbi:hypothetical protein LTR28_002734, partial [Elasticomyces elasticus]
MADVARRSQFRDALGPRAVEANYARDRTRHLSRQARESSSLSHDRSGARRHAATAAAAPTPSLPGPRPPLTADAGEARARYKMEVIEQPPAVVDAGAALSPALLVCLKGASRAPRREHEDELTRLLAVATLVSESGGGTNSNMRGGRAAVPLESGVLVGQHLFDSIHLDPRDLVEGGRVSSRNNSDADDDDDGLILGWVSFPDLAIRRPGCYRIRVTLIQMGGVDHHHRQHHHQGHATRSGLNIETVDSSPIRVVGGGREAEDSGL